MYHVVQTCQVVDRHAPTTTVTAISAAPNLTDLVHDLGPEGRSPDAVLDVFTTWAQRDGVELYAAQEEALLEIATGANVIVNTPTGSGKSLIALGAHVLA